MNMLFSIAWRNIWRHPARSGVLLAAIAAGLWAGIMASGYANGLMKQRFEYLIENELSHIQIHHPEFRTEREPWMHLSDAAELEKWIKKDGRIASWALRTLADGMAQSPVTTSVVQIRGIDPDQERAVTLMHERIKEGVYLDANVRNPVLIGQQLAQKLNLGTGNRLVLRFQDINNELIAGAFTIAGIFRSASSDYDERVVFVRASDLYELVAGKIIYHEVAIKLGDEGEADQAATDINDAFSHFKAATWHELSPELRLMHSFSGIYTIMIIVIIMLALAFGILNTMLMAIFERVRELGMLLAIGMNKVRVFLMIMLESVVLSLTGAAAGVGLAYLCISWLGRRGIDLSMFGDGLAEFGFEPVIYPFVMGFEYVWVAVVVIIAAMLASVYPAIKAIRLNPVEASKE